MGNKVNIIVTKYYRTTEASNWQMYDRQEKEVSTGLLSEMDFLGYRYSELYDEYNRLYVGGQKMVVVKVKR